jgi:hypothetical protein
MLEGVQHIALTQKQNDHWHWLLCLVGKSSGCFMLNEITTVQTSFGAQKLKLAGTIYPPIPGVDLKPTERDEALDQAHIDE